MKKFLKVLAILAAILTAISGIDVSGFADVLPDEWRPVLGAVITGSGVLSIFLIQIGDIADDGRKNGSFKPWEPMLFWLLLPVALLCLPSCSALKERGVNVTGELGFRPNDSSKARLVASADGLISQYLRRLDNGQIVTVGAEWQWIEPAK